MKIKKKIIIILLILLTLISIQTACADNNITEMENVTSINEEDTLNEIEINEKIESNNELDEKLSEEKIDINIEPIKVKTSYQTGNCTFKITNSNTGDLIKNKTIKFTVQITGMINYPASQTAKTDENGIATFILKNVNNQNPNNHNLNTGIHNLTITGLDDLNGKLITPITVEKEDVIITPVNYREDKGSSKKFTIKVTSKRTGEGISDARLSLYIPNSDAKYYNIICSQDGIGEIGVSGLNIGEYPVTIKTNDTNLNNAESSSVIRINKYPADINIESVAYYYNSGKTIVLNTTNKTGAVVNGVLLNITIDGKTYSVKTGKDGKATFTTPLNVGSHEIKVSVNSNIYQGQASKTVNIKKSVAKIKISNAKIYYNSKKQLTVKLINSKTNEVMFNSKLNVQFMKSGKLIHDYHGITNLNGEIRFNIKLKPGQYAIIIKGEDSKNFILKQAKSKLTVKKIPVKLTVKKSSKKLKIKVTKGTKKTLSGVKLKIKVKTAKSTKTYYVKSNSKGIALLKLKSGSNKITINVNDETHSSKTLKKTIKV